MALVLVRRQLFHWDCPECGPICDQSLELYVGRARLGRWFEDAHLGPALDPNVLEFRLCEHLELGFGWLERLRSQRTQAGALGQTLDALLQQALLERGHQWHLSEQHFHTSEPTGALPAPG